MLDFDRLERMLDRVSESREPELVLLNGHLLVERMLVAAVGARLGCGEDDVPRFSFRTLLQLAFRDEGEAKPLVWLNELRNALAHQFDALESEQFSDLVRRLGFPWPSGALERAVVIQLIVFDAEYRVLTRMIDELDAPLVPASENEEEDMDELRQWAVSSGKTVQLAKQLVENNAWDGLVDVFKPGWRSRTADNSVR